MFSSISNIKRSKLHLILAGLSLLFAVFISFYIVFASGPFDIVFPVPELGNCLNQNQCKAYCDRTENFKACSEFAAKHGFVVKVQKEEIEHRIDRFVEILESGGGPGACKTEAECRTYCEDPSHIEACLEFAENHNLLPTDELREAKKVAKAMRSGAKLPGGCRNQQTCEAYCSQSNHLEECLAFAEKSGIIHKKEELGFMKKAVELMSRGESPGGCQSRSACETYCSEPANQEACFEFGVKVGFIKSEQADEFRRFAREGGPGACRSRETCEAFCNNPANQETCLNFAQERGFIKEDEVKHIKESMGHFRIGLEQAPPEVAECLKANLGQNIIEDIKAGRLMPGPEIGNKVRVCFESHLGRFAPPHEAFRVSHPKSEKCLRENFGGEFENIRSGQSIPTPEMGEKIRACFELTPRPKPPSADEILKNAPPDVQACLKEVLGPDFENIAAGRVDFSFDLKDKIRSCFEKFISQGPGETAPSAERSRGFLPPNRPPGFDAPPMSLGFEAGPGGCRTPEECMNYCVSHKEECFRFGGGGVQPPQPGPSICPAMPTVDSCPEGQVRYKIFSSPECGAYYDCRPGETFIQPPQPPVSISPRPELCAQVITSAHDPATGACKQFSTPCDVPQGWIKGCPSGTDAGPGPLNQPLCPVFAMPASCKENISSDLCRQEIQKLQAAYPCLTLPPSVLSPVPSAIYPTSTYPSLDKYQQYQYPGPYPAY